MKVDMEKGSPSMPDASKRTRGVLTHVLVFVSVVATLLHFAPDSVGTFVHECGAAVRAPTPKGPIDWKECGKGFECGHLEVPLDYHNISAGNITLAVGRYLAKSKDRKGSIFVNPGGPGGSGLSFMYRAGPQLSDVLDGKYDIVSWDPRGINGSSPRVECFPDKRTQDLYDLEHSTGISTGNLSTLEGQEALRVQLQQAYGEAELIAGMCEEYTKGDILKHVGTSTVVRDLEFFASVLEGKETPINFAGFSYGTAIGSYFVNMFPDRVGRVLIDGVVEPVSWANEPEYLWGPRDYEDAEQGFEHFVLSCVTAGPERCALAVNTTSARKLSTKIRQTVSDLYIHPLPVPHSTRPGVLHADDVSSSIFGYMYRPRSWPELASKLAALLSGDGAPFLSDIQSGLNLSDTTSAQRTTYAINAVTCVDGPPLAGKYTPEEAIEMTLNAAVRTYETTTTLFTSSSIEPTCFLWKETESERYTGPWNSSLANTILVIGNTADPICPVANAKAVNSYLVDSRLIIQDGPGHCSLAQTSLCTGKVLREYFLDGILPENGKICPVTEVVFPPKPPINNGTDLVGSNMGAWMVSEGEELLSEEDMRLLEKLRAFGGAAQADMGVFKGMRM